jgi:hypothetical protein
VQKVKGVLLHAELFYAQANIVLGQSIPSIDFIPINSDHKVSKLSVRGLWSLIKKNEQYK